MQATLIVEAEASIPQRVLHWWLSKVAREWLFVVQAPTSEGGAGADKKREEDRAEAVQRAVQVRVRMTPIQECCLMLARMWLVSYTLVLLVLKHHGKPWLYPALFFAARLRMLPEQIADLLCALLSASLLCSAWRSACLSGQSGCRSSCRSCRTHWQASSRPLPAHWMPCSPSWTGCMQQQTGGRTKPLQLELCPCAVKNGRRQDKGSCA